MANKKLTIEETGCRKQADDMEQFIRDPENPPPNWVPTTLDELKKNGHLQRHKERILWYRSRAYCVSNAVNTVEWRLGHYLGIEEVEEILARTGSDAVDVSVKKKKKEGD